MPSRFTADWLLPIADAPLPRGVVTVDGGRIVAVEASGPDQARDATDLGRAVILPALVNAHTHLELSYLRDRVPAAAGFTSWVRQLMGLRREYPDPNATEIVDAAAQGLAEAQRSGTGLIADISNTLVTVPLLQAAGMPARVFHELLGFNAPDAEARVAASRQAAQGVAGGDVRISVAPHAPYSVSPALFSAIRTSLDAGGDPITSVHLGESPDEVQFVRHATGPLRTLLEDLGVWTEEGTGLPAGLSPVAYLSKIGFLDRCVLAVHGVQFDGDDLSRLAALGVTVVSCPRSNVHVGVGSPPLEAFYAMDVDVAFGTDSLASVPDLNLFSELAEARRLASRVSARRLLESATLVGARALGFDAELGTMEAGKRARLIAVRVPEGVSDVEAYLVSGIRPDVITWLDA